MEGGTWVSRAGALVVVTLLIAGCGRFGFDEFDDPGADPGTGTNTTSGQDDAGIDDLAQALECPGGACSCPPGEECSFECTGAECELDCPNGRCHMTCYRGQNCRGCRGGGGCFIDCNEPECQFTCVAGRCER